MLSQRALCATWCRRAGFADQSQSQISITKKAHMICWFKVSETRQHWNIRSGVMSLMWRSAAWIHSRRNSKRYLAEYKQEQISEKVALDQWIRGHSGGSSLMAPGSTGCFSNKLTFQSPKVDVFDRWEENSPLQPTKKNTTIFFKCHNLHQSPIMFRCGWEKPPYRTAGLHEKELQNRPNTFLLTISHTNLRPLNLVQSRGWQGKQLLPK